MPSNSTEEACYKSIDASEVTLAAGEGGKRVAVFCGSAAGLHPEYHEAAARLAELLAARRCALIYGGGSWGLMGEVARKAHHHGMPILGVLPEFMRSSSGPCYGELVMVKGMAERKTVINAHADVFVVLPGGFGTIDEMSEMLTWNQLGINNKLIGILNTRGYYRAWWEWCCEAVREGFVSEIFQRHVILADTPEELVEQLLTRVPEAIPGKYFTRA